MTDNNPSVPPPPWQTTDATSTQPPTSGTTAHNAFFGPNGLRAGWRLLVAAVIFYAAGRGAAFVTRHITGKSVQGIFASFTPRAVLFGEAVTFVLYLLTIWIMSAIEGRRLRDYGLGLSAMFAGRFWIGVVTGFASISLLLGALKVAGAFQLGQAALHGSLVWEDAGLWGLAFLFVGFQEECTSRGYLLFTLSTGVGFWPAAIATSLLFGGLHLGNSGESYVGALSAGGIGFFFCILLRKTGNLWAAIGFHAAWDWGETFFFGVPDSGFSAQGHLFSASFGGPVWLTGGSVGPEGSWLCLILIALLCIGAGFLPGRKFPNPDAIPDPRRRRAEPAPTLFPEAANRLSENAT